MPYTNVLEKDLEPRMTSYDYSYLNEVTQFTNDLSHFKLLGILYFYNLPEFPCPSVTAPDGFSWCDFPYDNDAIFRGGYTLSELPCQLRYLIRAAYIRLTFRLLRSGIAVVRVYILPNGVEGERATVNYRRNVRIQSMPSSQRKKAYHVAMGNVLSLLDYSYNARKIDSDTKLACYIKKSNAVIPLLNCLEPYHHFTRYNFNNSLDNFILSYNIERMIDGKSYSIGKDERQSSPANFQQRLTRVYDGLPSPNISQHDSFVEFQKTIDSILGNNIMGVKSSLYEYQRESIATMYMKETCSKNITMPSLICISNSKVYMNIRDFKFTVRPPVYHTPRGGILAENMGLGKTYICLALICLTKYEISKAPIEDNLPVSTHVKTLLDTCVDYISQKAISWKKYYDDLPRICVEKLENTVGYYLKPEVQDSNYNMRYVDNSLSFRKLYLSSTTLVVIPDNLFPQWVLELEKHVQKGFLKVLFIPSTKARVPTDVKEIISYDAVFISLRAFAKQFKNPHMVLRSIYWKRLIVDEGSNMDSKWNDAVRMARSLISERRWAITGTPTSGLTTLFMEEDENNYVVREGFDPYQDLCKLGSLVTNFFQIEPWYSTPRLWSDTITKPFKAGTIDSEYELSEFLKHLIVRHKMEDVRKDIVLPKLHHKATFLKPSFFDRLSINLFTAVLATNAVTSQQQGQDYMFDRSNRKDLRRLIGNLQKATFYWTGFSVQDVQNLLNICRYSLTEHKAEYSDASKKLLRKCIYVSKVALSNNMWRTNSSIHEMSYFVTNLPDFIRNNYTTSIYSKQGDNFGNPVGVYGFPQLITVQRFYYHNRLISTSDQLAERMQDCTAKFWKNYGRTNDRLNGVKRGSHKNNDELDLTSVDFDSIKDIDKIPSWASNFDPIREEYRFWKSRGEEPDRKKRKVLEEHNLQPLTYQGTTRMGSLMRSASIIGTASAKLSYLTSRLLENEIKGRKSIVFYQYEHSAYYLTEFLDILGANYLMYSPNVGPQKRSENLIKFGEWDTVNQHMGHGIALIMDLKLASHGLTILAATDVFFISPVWSRAMEAQAIKRAHRIGQTHEVHVETLILENTIEEEMYYRRSASTEVSNREHEAIDNTEVQQFVLKFQFLKLFDQGYSTNEIAEVQSKADTAEAKTQLDDDNGISMRNISSFVDSGNRYWDLPLFTTTSMEKLSENDSAKKNKHGNIKRSDLKQMDSKDIGSWKKANEKSAKLMMKLQKERKRVH